ncbi:MAG TPA: type II toxin-antitoxin system antitoxin, RelB/DinJ family [Mitsuokella multacida]|jgi:DNA-damage-inducible protein J|nr:type II toxin-antitoxin system antitoxin, RelB/DinJ family [Mitsuokella multacida]
MRVIVMCLKREAEAICEEMGLTMSAAVTIFMKRLVKDCAIPFRITAGDPFYSETNQRHLHAAAERMDAGKFVVHNPAETENVK